MAFIPHILAGGETDTYTWSQQGSPEICFCTGGNRAFSEGICDLKTSPDRRGCPVPCLRGNGMRQTNREGCRNWKKGGCRIKRNTVHSQQTLRVSGAHQIRDRLLLPFDKKITKALHHCYELWTKAARRALDSDSRVWNWTACVLRPSCVHKSRGVTGRRYLCRMSWTSWCVVMPPEIHYDLHQLVGGTIITIISVIIIIIIICTILTLAPTYINNIQARFVLPSRLGY